MVQRYLTFAASISNIHKIIQKLERREMERFGLKGPHGPCLLAVAAHPEGITAAQLCQSCDKDKASISRSLAELETMGLLCRRAGYRAPVTLTEEGRRVSEEIARTVRSTMDQASFGMDRQRRLAFYEMLNEISSNLETVCEEGEPAT